MIRRPHANEKDNIKSIVKVYEAFGRGDVAYIIDQLTDDVRWVTHLDPIVPWSGEFLGKTNVPKFFGAINDSGETTAFNPGEFIAQGDTVVSLGEFGCKVKATGKSDLGPWVFIWKFRDGKISSYEQFHDASIANAFR